MSPVANLIDGATNFKEWPCVCVISAYREVVGTCQSVCHIPEEAGGALVNNLRFLKSKQEISRVKMPVGVYHTWLLTFAIGVFSPFSEDWKC